MRNKRLLALALSAALLVPAVSTTRTFAQSNSEIKVVLEEIENINFKEMTDAEREMHIQQLLELLKASNVNIVEARKALAAAEAQFAAATEANKNAKEVFAKLSAELEKAEAELKAAKEAEEIAKENHKKVNEEYKEAVKANDKKKADALAAAQKAFDEKVNALAGKVNSISSELTEAKAELAAAENAKPEVKAQYEAKVDMLEKALVEAQTNLTVGRAKAAEEHKRAVTKAEYIHGVEETAIEFKYKNNDNYKELPLLVKVQRELDAAINRRVAAKNEVARLTPLVTNAEADAKSKATALKVAKAALLSAQNELASANYNKIVINKKLIDINKGDKVTTSADQLKLSEEEKKELEEVLKTDPASLEKQIAHAKAEKEAAEAALNNAEKVDVAVKDEKKDETKKEETKKVDTKKADAKGGMPKTGIAAVSSLAVLAMSGLGVLTFKKRK